MFETHEMVEFPNGEWYDVVKDSYVYVRYGPDLSWFIPLDPINWLANEDAMRTAYTIFTCIDNPILREIMCSKSNSLYVYMKFMCNSYPYGFGNAIKSSCDEGYDLDGCETFLVLGGNYERITLEN